MMRPEPTNAVEILRSALPGLRAVYMFGSAAVGHLREDSDIDLAVLDERPLPPARRFALEGECSVRMGRSVDLIDLATASPVLLFQVLESGTLLFGRSPVEVAQFETTALSRYCAWNEERRELVEDIRARGNIYGR